MLAVLRKPSVIEHPRLNIDLRRHPLGDRAGHQPRIPRTHRQELLQRLIVRLPTKPLDDRLKRLAGPLLQQPAQIQATIDHLHRPVDRLREHLGSKRLQTFHHHRRPIDLTSYICLRLTHRNHHDLLAIGNREKASPHLPRIPTQQLTKYY